MAKKEVKTDLWIARQLDDSKIKYDAQGSDVKEINDALQSASKRGTGNAGYPEYVAVVKDFVIVIEVRPMSMHCASERRSIQISALQSGLPAASTGSMVGACELMAIRPISLARTPAFAAATCSARIMCRHQRSESYLVLLLQYIDIGGQNGYTSFRISSRS